MPNLPQQRDCLQPSEALFNDITSKTNVLGISVLILLLVGLLVGIVVFGIKLTRR